MKKMEFICYKLLDNLEVAFHSTEPFHEAVLRNVYEEIVLRNAYNEVKETSNLVECYLKPIESNLNFELYVKALRKEGDDEIIKIIERVDALITEAESKLPRIE